LKEVIIPALTYQGLTYEICKPSELLAKGVPQAVVDPATFDQAVIDSRAEIRQAAQAAYSALTASYPDCEVSTFNKQEKEARAYALDPTVITPIIDAIVAENGADKAVQVDRVIQKADVFEVSAGQVVGKRQRLESELDTLLYPGNILADIEAITW
jgi:hypothetical protein